MVMDLVNQLNHLDALLLSTVSTEFPDPLTDEEKAATNAYVVLSHAVLEEYIEDAFERHFARLAAWLDSPTVPLEAAKLALALGDWVKEDKRVAFKKRQISGYVKGLQSSMRSQLGQNHGIKATNIQHMARLVGVDWPALEAELSTALADLSTLGSMRGEAGHLSPFSERAVRITRQAYPDDVRSWVRSARDGAMAISGYLDMTVREQEPPSLVVDWDGN